MFIDLTDKGDHIVCHPTNFLGMIKESKRRGIEMNIIKTDGSKYSQTYVYYLEIKSIDKVYKCGTSLPNKMDNDINTIIRNT